VSLIIDIWIVSIELRSIVKRKIATEKRKRIIENGQYNKQLKEEIGYCNRE
jgi:hypothetical protein